MSNDPSTLRHSNSGGESTLGKSYLIKHFRGNISPMLAIAPSSSVVGVSSASTDCQAECG